MFKGFILNDIHIKYNSIKQSVASCIRPINSLCDYALMVLYTCHYI